MEYCLQIESQRGETVLMGQTCDQPAKHPLTLFRVTGLEPARVLPHMLLKHARLPISPHSVLLHFTNVLPSFALLPEWGAKQSPG